MNEIDESDLYEMMRILNTKNEPKVKQVNSLISAFSAG